MPKSGIEILRSRRSLAVVVGRKTEWPRRTDKSRTLENATLVLNYLGSFRRMAHRAIWVNIW